MSSVNRRIGIDCRLWNETGVGRYIRNLVYELTILKPESEFVLFVLPKDKEHLKSHISNLKVEIIEVNIRWHSVKEQFAFPHILNQANLDLMHFPYFSVPIMYNKPYVITIHDLILHHFPTGKASTLPGFMYWIKLQTYKFVMQYAAIRAKKIVSVSQATKEEIIKHLHIQPSKIEVTYEGVDITVKPDPSYHVPSTNYFLYVGNAYPHKNLERLITAFELLLKKKPDIQLVLAGKNDFFYHRLSKKIQEAGLEKAIIIVHPSSDKELASLYHHATALILPSLMEGFGLPVLEAMVQKCLVICSDIPAFHEVCGDAGIYINPNAEQDIAEKLSYVSHLSQKERNDYTQRANLRLKDFSWEKMAKQTIGIYESCISI